jgi:hypothetical protein
LHDLLENQGLRGDYPAQDLNLDVSTEELRSDERAFTYADLYAMLGNEDTVAWLTPHIGIAVRGRAVNAFGQLHGSCHFRFTADGEEIIALARSPVHLLEICDVVLRLLAVSVVHSIIMHKWTCLDVFINAPTLAYLMEQCQSLKALTLRNLDMDEDQIRVFGAFSRPGLEIELKHCKITSTGARALAEILGRNQGPTKLDLCYIDNVVLVDGLRGNSRLKILRPRLSATLFRNSDDCIQELLAIAVAVKENKGLVGLDLNYGLRVSDETWGAICDSLKTHPTLEVLDLREILMGATMHPAALSSRVLALLDMMKINMSIHTIRLHSCYRQHELFRGSVIPYLDTNRLRSRVRAIQKIRPIAYRAKVLGQALLAAPDANSFWMILSGNAEVALFPSTTTPAANLPTPVTTAAAAAAASSTENDADVAASVMPTFTTNAAGSLPAATAAAAPSFDTDTATASGACAFAPTVAIPSASPKRKARP